MGIIGNLISSFFPKGDAEMQCKARQGRIRSDTRLWGLADAKLLGTQSVMYAVPVS